MISLIDAVISIGVCNYKFLKPLSGPEVDVSRVKEIFVDNDKIVANHPLYYPLINPTAEQVRSTITNVTHDTSCLNTTLVFYFAGHGIPIGNQDLALCTVDTRYHEGFSRLEPFTYITVSEIIAALSSIESNAVIIIDTCYAGVLSRIQPSDVSAFEECQVTRGVTRYSLLLGAPEDKSINDSINGGEFTQVLYNWVKNGVNKDTPAITLGIVDNQLVSYIQSRSIDVLPRIRIDGSHREIILFRNSKFRKTKAVLDRSMITILRILYNDGNIIEFEPNELLTISKNQGAYANNSKLSYNGWEFIEIVRKNGPRKITERGVAFLQGKIKVRKRLIKDPITGIYSPDERSELVGIEDI